MKYIVLGYTKDRGAKTTIEIEAHSKGEAEHRARQTGMQVIRAQIAEDYTPEVEPAASGPAAAPAKSGGSGIFMALLIMAAVAGVAWFFRGPIMAFLSGLTGK